MNSIIDVTVGVLGRAHGIKGEVAIGLRTDEPERRFGVGAQVFVVSSDKSAPKTLTVASARWAGEKFLVRFAELPSRTEVEAARGWELVAHVPANELPEDEDEFYDRQLFGLSVIDHEGNEVGQVREIIHLPFQDLLAVDTDDGERLVPFVEELVPVIDLLGGFLQLADVPGLIDEVE